MPANGLKLRDINNLNEADIKEICEKYGESINRNRFGDLGGRGGRVGIIEPDYSDGRTKYDTFPLFDGGSMARNITEMARGISNLPHSKLSGKVLQFNSPDKIELFKQMINIPKIKFLPQDGTPNEHILPEKLRLQLAESRYNSEWLYPNIMQNWRVEAFDKIDSDNEYYDYFYNIQRSAYGLPRIELKVGETYILKLGKKSIKKKEMVLVKIDNLEKGKFPELYFTEVHNWLDGGVWNNSALMNISFGKILETKMEEKENV